jgi:hypothetical protein
MNVETKPREFFPTIIDYEKFEAWCCGGFCYVSINTVETPDFSRHKTVEYDYYEQFVTTARL